MSDRTVVFVCLHGAAKSLIAATLFQRLADERGLAVRSTFAGTEPDPAIQPNVVARLLEEGVDVRPLRPRRVTRDELASAWRVVSFGCDLTALAPDARIERWDDVPAGTEDYGRARDVIAARVRKLLGQASRAQRTPIASSGLRHASVGGNRR